MQQNWDFYTNDIQLNSNNNLQFEKKIWNKYVLNILVILPIICTLCGNNNINIYDYESICNPYGGRCTSAKCRAIYYLRAKTILDMLPLTKVSTILYIFKLSILEKKYQWYL